VVREVGTQADPAVDRIEVDGRAIPPAEAPRYVLLNKPRGVLTSRSDPHGRPVVTDLVPSDARLYPVGRLDADVEGALILTNDGALTHRLLHPRYAVPRVYEADVHGRVSPQDVARWRRGVELEDGPAVPVAVQLVSSGSTSRLRLTFTEGRKHEVKRYCRALGHPVAWLRRVAFGPVALGDLPPGRWRALEAREVSALRRVASGAPAPRKRG